MKKIELTQGKFALVDDSDFEWLNQWKWHALKYANSRTFYAARTVYLGGGQKHFKTTSIQMHRLINNTPSGKFTDHANGNGLDNQRHNIRTATRSQNKMNSVIHKNNTSGYRGVSWNKTAKKWVAQIMVRGKVNMLGYFTIREEAGDAYNKKAKESFGIFYNTQLC